MLATSDAQRLNAMKFEHACFISFPRGPGNDTKFADEFFNVFTKHLADFDKNLSIFKYDRCEHRRQGDDWAQWIQRELCHSASMIAVCAPNYFNGSPACVSEFRGMETLIESRTAALGEKTRDWLLGVRLKDTVPMPALNPYDVRDFLDCCVSPKRVYSVQKNREAVEKLANRVYNHWNWVHSKGRNQLLGQADICGQFTLPRKAAEQADPFPHAGAVT